MKVCRGIRGATTVDSNDAAEIVAAARDLLEQMIDENGIDPNDVASAYFTTTRDLTAQYPALAGRLIGWQDVALLCGHEMEVPGGLERCIRVLVHWNTVKTAEEIVHVYIRGAENLRPDRAELRQLRQELRAAGR